MTTTNKTFFNQIKKTIEYINKKDNEVSAWEDKIINKIKKKIKKK